MWNDFLRLYLRLDANKPVVKVLLVCQTGTKRSVAASEILKYIVTAMGKVVEKDSCHLSKDIWKDHLATCPACGDHKKQRRFKEVMEKAYRIATTM